MKRNKYQKNLLRVVLLINAVLLIPLILRKKPIKDWIIVFLLNGFTNSIIDNILTRYKIVKYPIRLYPKVFDSHILFDYLIYPTFTIIYNQWTYQDNLFRKVYKLFLLTIPSFLVELWAERKTELIDWSRKWKWYHTFFGIIFKSLFTTMFLGLVRWTDKKLHSGES